MDGAFESNGSVSVILEDGGTLEERARLNGRPYDSGELAAYPRLKTRKSIVHWRWSGLGNHETAAAYLEPEARGILASGVRRRLSCCTRAISKGR